MFEFESSDDKMFITTTYYASGVTGPNEANESTKILVSASNEIT